MHTFSKVLRSLSLTLLSGGSAAIVFAAIALVKAATANGVPVAEAATANAPIFIHYAKIAFGAAMVLLLAEIMDFLRPVAKSKLDYARYAAGIACIACVCVYAFAIVPPMEKLLPTIKTAAEAHEEFKRLHELSRAVFGASILFAFIDVLLPAFRKDRSSAHAIETSSKKEDHQSINAKQS